MINGNSLGNKYHDFNRQEVNCAYLERNRHLVLLFEKIEST